ncbi:MAG: restriction endonuclease subunit S, partial [Candidatus Woesearchaeota archaeon]
LDKNKIPLPPLSEQKAIAEVLQTIQEAKEKTEAVIEATKKLKKSMMKHLFTYGNVPLSDVDKVKLKDTEIGLIPEHWQVVRLGDVVIETVSGDWGNENYFENSILCYVLRGTDFVNIEKKQFYKIPKRYIKINSFEKRHLQENDILIELSGGGPDQPTGRIFLVNNSFLNSLDNVCFSNFIKKIRICTDKSDPNFFYRYWQYLYEKGKTKIYEKRTTGIRNFKLNDFIDKESIPLPPLPEQQAIAEILQEIDEKIQKEEAKKKALENLFKSMLNNLMSGKLRVKKIGDMDEL